LTAENRLDQNRRVAYFRDDAEVYERIGRLLQPVVEDEELAARFQGGNTVIRYHRALLEEAGREDLLDLAAASQ